MDLTCKEVDFSVDEVEKEILEEEREKRYTAETKIYFIMKDYQYIESKRHITRICS